MKTTIKLTAIAVITVLVALACSNPVSLTDRDYRDRNESKSAEYTNNSQNYSDNLPKFSPTYLKYYNSTAVVADSDRETTITFPENADVLKVTGNDAIEAALKEFLTLSQYTNPDTNPAPAVVYTPSRLTDAVKYTVVRSVGADIIVKVDVPDIDYIVAKIDASKYKVFGQTLDRDRDGKTDIYDDYYQQIHIDLSTKYIEPSSYTDVFFPPVATITIDINGPESDSFTNTTPMPSLFTIHNSFANGANNAYKRTILSDIASKIEIQKYDIATNTWATEGTVASYDSTTTAPAGSGFTTDLIYGSFTPVDLGIYRIAATGVANLTTKENYGATGQPAKIRINAGGDDLSVFQNTWYSDPVSYCNYDARLWVTDNPIEHVNVKYDSNKRNVVLDIFFSKVYDSKAATPADAWLKEMTLEEFNKNFKMVYLKNGSALLDGDTFRGRKLGDIIEIKVAKIAYSASKYLDSNITSVQTNCITVTLDPSFKYDGTRIISFLFTTGFKYASNYITFGTPDIDSYYNGSYFWRSYGDLEEASSGYDVPNTPGYWEDADGIHTGTDPEDQPNPDDVWVDEVPGYWAPPTYDNILLQL